ncbi:ComF family protein [Acinetobacter indicus]|uniref:ComF family protein n=1 Tax=Acinetobacter indicus TaxID=756892 RepID=UPI000CECDD4D|nr:phosphoribosyltransferase family protein [Acinetobacter indicus]
MLSLNYENFEKAFALFYYLKNTDMTHVSNRILSLKEGDFGSFGDYCTEIMASELKEDNIRYCVRALSSKEKNAFPQSTIGSQKIGLSLSNKLELEYIPHILTKKITRPMHDISSRSERLANITGSYGIDENIAKNIDLNNQKVLIVDDISTTGATAQEIARSLISHWPAIKLYFVCVAKTNNEIGDAANKDLLNEYGVVVF